MIYCDYCAVCRIEIDAAAHAACVDAGSTLDLCPTCAAVCERLTPRELNRADMLAQIRLLLAAEERANP